MTLNLAKSALALQKDWRPIREDIHEPYPKSILRQTGCRVPRDYRNNHLRDYGELRARSQQPTLVRIGLAVVERRSAKRDGNRPIATLELERIQQHRLGSANRWTRPWVAHCRQRPHFSGNSGRVGAKPARGLLQARGWRIALVQTNSYWRLARPYPQTQHTSIVDSRH